MATYSDTALTVQFLRNSKEFTFLIIGTKWGNNVILVHINFLQFKSGFVFNVHLRFWKELILIV